MTRRKISFPTFCSEVLQEPISPAWSVAYRAFDGERLKDAEIEIWRALTGRDQYGPSDSRELVALKGRRAQGSKTACKFLTYKIHTSNYRQFATKGDRLHVPVIAQDRDTAREIMSYLSVFYSDTELRSEVSEILKNSIELKNGFILRVATCSYRAPRGITAPLALLDELGVWRVDGSDVDKEVIRSLTPAMVQFPNRKLILLGSPWVKAGVLFERWSRRTEFGSDRLVLHCPTPTMNPSISPDELAREQAADPQNYRREFLAEFLDDVDAFLPDSDITAAVRSGVREAAPIESCKGSYFAAIDASSLTGRDRFVFGIARPSARGSSGLGATVDLLRGWMRSPVPQVCDEIAAIARTYGLRSITADQHGYAFLRELMSARGIELRQLAFTTRSKPEVFLDLKLALSQLRLQLLDHPESLRELRMLESRRTSGGNYSIAAPRGSHDDYACVIALLAHLGKVERDSGHPFLVTFGGGGSFLNQAGRRGRLQGNG